MFCHIQYGTVYLARHISTNQLYALKHTKHLDLSNGITHTTLREVSILKYLKHDNIVGLVDAIYNIDYDTPCLYLVFEYCNTDLHNYLNKYNYDNSKINVKNLIYQMLQGLAYMHTHGVLHRDLKPQNILLNESPDTIKIGDLGLGRQYSQLYNQYTHEVVTLWYRAPEILLGSTHYSTGIDIWSLGCIIGEIIIGKPLFTGDCEFGQLIQIFQILGSPTEEQWPSLYTLPDMKITFPRFKPKTLNQQFNVFNNNLLLLDLLCRMLVYDPDQRISAKQALSHAYFDDIRISEHEQQNDVVMNAAVLNSENIALSSHICTRATRQLRLDSMLKNEKVKSNVLSDITNKK